MDNSKTRLMNLILIFLFRFEMNQLMNLNLILSFLFQFEILLQSEMN